MNRRSEAGMALLAAMLFAVAVLAWISSILTASVAVQRRERYRNGAQQAMAAAESGVHAAVAGLNGPNAADLLAAGSLQAILRGTGEGAQRYDVLLLPAGEDGIDNDVDGAIDEADEADMVEVSSTGRAERIARTVQVTLLRRYRAPGVQAALFLADPGSTLHLSENTSLCGDDQGGAAPSLPGLGVVGSPADLLASLDEATRSRITGLGSSPSVAELAGLTDVFQLYEDAARNADLRLQPGINTAAGTAWGTESEPRLLYGTGGEVELRGSASTGVGILVVDGDLVLSGDLQWRGLVIASGDIRLVGDAGGGVAISGALFSLPRSGTTQPPSLILTGAAQVHYSAVPLATAGASVADRYTILNWREAANPDE